MNREERRRRARLGEAVDTPDTKAQNSAKARVRTAEKRLENGDHNGAKTALDEALLLDPENPRACYLLAMISLNSGELEVARDHILKAAMNDDENPDVHANCSAILNLVGRPMEAEAAAREAIKLAPDMPEAHCNLGVALEAQGKAPDALASLKKSVELRPNYADALISLGNLQFRSGDLISAAEAFADAVRAWPENAMARTNLAVTLRHLGELAAAEEQCVEAIQLDSGYAEAYNALGNVYLQLGNLPGAIEAFENAVKRRDGYPEASANLAGAQFKSGDYEAAERSYLQTLESYPTFAEAAHGLGVVYLAQGRVENAVSRFKDAVGIRPGFGEAWMNIVDAADGEISDADLDALKKNARDARLAVEDRIGFQFALGKAFDGRGDHVSAFAAFKSGNDLSTDLADKNETRFDADEFDAEINSVISVLKKEAILRLEEYGDQEASPVFVCGMPRSGTTLVEQLIASHPHARGAGEVDIISGLLDAYPEDVPGLAETKIRELADAYMQRLPHSLRDGQVVVDKTPQNIFYLGFIKVLFPRAKFIRCTRDIRDVAWSCYSQNFRSSNMNWSNDLEDIGRFAKAEERVAEHWSSILGSDLLTVSYESLVDDFELQSKAVINFIGLPWDEAVLMPHLSENAALTASNWQVRRPIYQSSVGRWRRYADKLDHLG